MMAEIIKSGWGDLTNPFHCSLKLARALPTGLPDAKLATIVAQTPFAWGGAGAHSAIEDTRALSAALRHFIWPLERTEAERIASMPPPVEKQRKPEGATASEGAVEIGAVAPAPKRARASKAAPAAAPTPVARLLPEGFQPISAEADSRIQRYEPDAFEGSITKRGVRWTPEEESRLIDAFVTRQMEISEIVANHGRTPAALFLRLESLGAIAGDHPYAGRR
jgi:hypothetical protein